MDLDKIIRIGLAERGMSTQDLATAMECSVSRVNKLRKAEHCNTKTLEKLTAIFGKPALQDLVAMQDR